MFIFKFFFDIIYLERGDLLMKNSKFIITCFCLASLSFGITFYIGYQLGSQIEFNIKDSAIKKENKIKKLELIDK